MSTLERAIGIAVEAHAGQKDKAGQPYILHALRVMLGAAGWGDTSRIVGVLHDVVEDTDWTLEDLREEGFHPAVLDAIDALTRRPHEDYGAYLGRLDDGVLAPMVKMADLVDNLDRSRIPNPTAHDLRRWEKYEAALAQLRGATPLGPPSSEPLRECVNGCPRCRAEGAESTVHLDERWDGPGLHLSKWWCSNGHSWSVRSMPWGADERRMLRQARQAVADV